MYLSAFEYLGKEEVLQDSVKSGVDNIINKSIISALKEASEDRAVWVREVVEDITKRVV